MNIEVIKLTLKIALDALNLPSMKTMAMLEQRDVAIAAILNMLEQLEQINMDKL